MRLYVNENEIATLKNALYSYAAMIASETHEKDEIALNLYQRVVLCESLQHNVKRAGGSNNDLT